MFWRNEIRETLAKIGRIGVDPRHVEAFMRDEYGTFDGLSRSAFHEAVADGAESALADPALADALADSYGLPRDGFAAWQGSKGLARTENVDGFEVVR